MWNGPVSKGIYCASPRRTSESVVVYRFPPETIGISWSAAKKMAGVSPHTTPLGSEDIGPRIFAGNCAMHLKGVALDPVVAQQTIRSYLPYRGSRHFD